MIEGSRFTDARDIVGLAASPTPMIPPSRLEVDECQAQLYRGCADVVLRRAATCLTTLPQRGDALAARGIRAARL